MLGRDLLEWDCSMRESKFCCFCIFLFLFCLFARHTVMDHDTPEGRFSLKSKELGMGLLFVERYLKKMDKPFTGVNVHIGGDASAGRHDSPCRKGEAFVRYD